MSFTEKIYGLHPVREALEQGIPINKVFIQKDAHNPRISEIISKLKHLQVPFQFVPKEKLNRLTAKNHQGIIAIASPVEFQSIEQVLPQIFEEKGIPLIAILDSITDVRNFGAIARSAECFGIDALVVPASGSAMLNDDAMKSSAGALNKVRICREINFMNAINCIRSSGLRIIGCSEKAQKLVSEEDFSLPTAIVMGAEGEGIHPALLEVCESLVKIPMQGDIQSLNVSVAAGIIFYEARRIKA